jgi:hypothetical protein
MLSAHHQLASRHGYGCVGYPINGRGDRGMFLIRFIVAVIMFFSGLLWMLQHGYFQ